MLSLKDWKTRTKLLVTFITMIIITIFVSFNGLYTANRLHNNLVDFYQDGFIPNTTLSQIQLNQEKATTEMQRILWKAETLQDQSVIEEAVVALNEFTAENERLIQEYEASNLTGEKKELLSTLKNVNSRYISAREEAMKAARNGDFELAVDLNENKAKPLREEVSSILTQMREVDNQAAADMIAKDQTAYKLTRYNSVILMSLSILLGIVFTVLLSRNIAKPIKALEQHADIMAEGDFTKELPAKLQMRRDEIGSVAVAFAKMNEKIRAILKEVADTVEKTSTQSEELSATVEEVSAQEENISASVQEIASGMEQISASVEEVTASSTEIIKQARRLEAKANNGETKVEEIKRRAEEMKTSASKSKETSISIYDQKQQEIMSAIKDVEVVEEITKMADVISEIAAQTNLLALNAAIEAARAGEQGRGFAVVAEEVRKLAEHSAATAGDIHKVIQQVNAAVERLINNAADILKFIDEKVAPDYDMLEQTGDRYANDALFVKNLTQDFAATASEIAAAIDEIGKAIEGVAATIEEATASSEEISSNSMETTKALEEVAKMAQAQAEMAESLSELVAKFKV